MCHSFIQIQHKWKYYFYNHYVTRTYGKSREINNNEIVEINLYSGIDIKKVKY